MHDTGVVIRQSKCGGDTGTGTQEVELLVFNDIVQQYTDVLIAIKSGLGVEESKGMTYLVDGRAWLK